MTISVKIDNNNKLLKILWYLFITLLFSYGALLFGLSLLPFKFAKLIIGKLDLFSPEIFLDIVYRSRLCGLLLIFISIIIFFYRNILGDIIYDATSSLSSFLRLIFKSFYEYIINENKTYIVSLLIILLFGIVIRVRFLNQPMRCDESMTYLYFASKPLYIGVLNYNFTNNHPFNTFLIHLCSRLFGEQPWALRLPALLAGISLIPASYIFIRMYYGKYPAFLTAALVAASSPLIEFATNARGYSILILIFLIIFALAFYISHNLEPGPWLLFAILSALGFITIPVMVYPFGVVLTWLFLSIMLQKSDLSRGKLLCNIFFFGLITVFLTLLFYLPAICIYGIKAVLAKNPWVLPMPFSSFFPEIYVSLLAVSGKWNTDIPWVIRYCLMFGFLASIIFHKQLTNFRIPIILAVILWVFPVLMLQRVIPGKAVWLFLLPVYFGMASGGLNYISSKVIRYQNVLVIVVLMVQILLTINVFFSNSVYYSNDTGILRSAEPITLVLKKCLKSGDKVLAKDTSRPPLKYYFKLYGISLGYIETPKEGLNNINRIFIVVNKSYNDQKLEDLLKEGNLIDYKPENIKEAFSFEDSVVYLINLNR